MSDSKWLVFQVAAMRLAIPTSDVLQVVPVPLITTAPGTPRFLEGYFVLREEAVPVIRVDRLFNLAEQKLGVYSSLIVVRSDTPRIALHVDRVHAIRVIAEEHIHALVDSESFNACIVAQASIAGDTVYLLSTEQLLLERERQFLATHRQMTQDRLASVGASE